ncbi:uncharacterized protein LOC107606893 [Arachis ipaensis]|uniref:uncharacterized protein LOC107606893 n=1 Tax=Arachis ipaensis TaxID=130454 RepID=UPI0007AF52A5|nr:uncharacterized protein LOC107606893 [Arachis ipaensis]
MADHKSKFKCLTRQAEKIARIVDYDEGDQQNMQMNQEDVMNMPRDMGGDMHFEGNMPRVIRRDQNADDEALARMRANQRGKRYQVTRIFEDVLNRVGFNVGFMNQSYFVFTFPTVVQAAEVPRGMKNPKIVTKFASEVGESTTEHIVRYMVELENLANDENLKFFRGELNVTVTDLVALKREDEESIDDFMIHLKNTRSRYYVSLLKNEVVKVATMGFDFYMRRKLINIHIPDLAHLAERVRQEFSSEESDFVFPEVDLAKLKKGPPYVCSLLKKIANVDRSNDTKYKNGKKYSFDILKYDQIFDVLLKDKQLVLPKGKTLLSTKDLKGKPYCKFHQATSHSTNNCVRFRNLIQEAIMEGRLKFDDGKKDMKVDSDPFDASANFSEPFLGSIWLVFLMSSILIWEISKLMSEQYI